MKSYGRAPTFVMITGYEQVRSIAADIAGDKKAADRVELELPETGVWSGNVVERVTRSNCCSGPAFNACCVDDAHAKVAGKTGCERSSSEHFTVTRGSLAIVRPVSAQTCSSWRLG
jgi:hypothetical protein